MSSTPIQSRYVHPRSIEDPSDDAHSHGLEIASDASERYHHWIAELCRPFVGNEVLEIGAGHGAISRFLASGIERYVVTDSSTACLEILQGKFETTPNIEVAHFDLRAPSISGTYDTIVMFNVLEHIFDDEAALRTLGNLLRPDGRLVIYVPAFNWLYGAWDRKIGHYRRYSKERIAGVIREAGLEIEHLAYVNSLAVPAWFAFSRLGIRRVDGPGDEAPRSELALWDRFVIPLTRSIESHVNVPVGLNVLAVAVQPH